MAQSKTSYKTAALRGSFVHVVTGEPKKDDNGAIKMGADGKPIMSWSITLPLPKKDPGTKPALVALMAVLADACLETHGKVLKPGELKHYPIKDGDAPDCKVENFKGCWYFEAKSNYKPSFIDPTGSDLTEVEAYSGAWYKIKVSAYGWVNEFKQKGVSFNLCSGIKVKEDSRFGGGGDAKEDFAEDIAAGGAAGGAETDDGLAGLLGG